MIQVIIMLFVGLAVSFMPTFSIQAMEADDKGKEEQEENRKRNGEEFQQGKILKKIKGRILKKIKIVDCKKGEDDIKISVGKSNNNDVIEREIDLEDVHEGKRICNECNDIIYGSMPFTGTPLCNCLLEQN